MEFLRAVEDDLRALSVEARKKHPVVKEAAERGIVRLRGLREQYAAAVRESGGESPPTSRLRSQELLRPFLLACNHVDAGKVMTLHALGAIAHLMNRDAISPADAPNILRVLAIQAVAPSSAANAPDVQVKVLQTLLLTVTWRGCELAEEVLASALIVCLQLAEHRHATVRNAASATLRQVVSLLFDRVAGEELGGLPLPSPSRSPRGFVDEEGMASGEDAALEESGGGAPAWARGQPQQQQQQQEVLLSPRLEGMQPVERCAYYLIQDLCLICRGEGGTWLKHMVVPPALGMELIEQILAQHPRLFRERAEFGEVLRNQVCPLIVQTLRSGESELDFPLLVRLMRTIATVLGELGDALVPQCEVILAMLFQLLAGADLASAGGGGGPEGNRSGGGSSMVGAAASNLAATANSLLGAAVASLGSGGGGGGSGGGSSGAGAAGGGSGGRGRSGRMALWTVMLALEVMGGVCAQPGLVLAAFANYDSLAECTDVLAGMVRGLSRFVVEGSLASPPAAASLLAAAASCPWSAKGLPQLPRGFELLKETAPPAITEGEVLLQAVGVLLTLVEMLWGIVLERQLEGQLKPAIPSTRMHHPGGDGEEQEGEESPGALLHRMLVKEDVWQDLLRVLVHLLTHVSPPSPAASSSSSSSLPLQSSPADRLFDHALLGLERFALSLGVLGVLPAQTQALALAAKLAVPTLASELTSPMTTMASSSGASYTLTPRHFRAIKCLLRVVTFLANGLGGKGWESVVEAFDLLDACLYASGAPAASSPPGSEGDITAGAVSGAAAPDGRGGGVEEQKLANVLRRVVCFSALLEDGALVHLMGAYISHGEALLQAEESPPFNGGGGGAWTPARATRQASSAPALLPASSSVSAASTIPPPPGPASGPAATAAVAAPDRSVTAAALVLRQVVQAAAFNAYRYELIATAVANYLAFAAGTHNPTVRVYAVASLADLLTKALSRTEEGGSGGLKERLDAGVGYPVLAEGGAGVVGGGIGMVGYDLETLFLVRAELVALPSLLRLVPRATTAGSGAEDGGREVGPQVLLLRPLASLGACPYVDARAHALQALYRVLQSCGHVLNDGWAEVFDLLCTVAASASPPPLAAAAPAGAGAGSPRPVSAQGEGYGGGESPPAFGSLPAPLPVPAVPALWGDACLPLAFRSLKLVVDDNLDSVPRPHLGACVRCMGAFAAQALDMNVSLTAVGMVWSVADFVARPNTCRGQEGDAAAATDEGVVWPAILGELGKLALDSRPEVRNCAVNTLFACLVGHGPAFAPEGWGARARAVEGLVAAIEERAWAASGEELSGTVGMGASATTARGRLAAPKVVMHHSRDTAQKQWAETRVLAIQGLGRLHRAFLRPFWAHIWYGLLWTRTLGIAAAAVGSGARAPNAEVALAGANLLLLQLQLASKAGLAHGPLRAAAGMKVVDGALQQASSGSASPPSLRQRGQSAPDSPDGKGGGAASEEFEAAKAKLWEEAWAALRGAAGSYCEDQEGEVAAAFVLNLQTIYEGARGQELQESGRMLEFLELLDSVIEARLPLLPPLATTAGGEGGASAGLGGRNWRPPVLPNQREALTLLCAIRASDARVWGKVFALLTRLATAPHATSVSSAAPDDAAATAGGGGFTCVQVSKQFAKEAADCLMELYGQDHVPLAARAGAFDAIVRSLGGACLACARTRRGRRRGEWARLLLALQSGGGVGAEQAGTDRRASVSLPQPLSAVQASGALLTPVLLQGLKAVGACSLAVGNEEQQQQSARRRGRSRSKDEEDRQSEKERQLQLQRAWQYAVLAVEGFLIPWTPEEEAEGQQAADDVEPAAQQPSPQQKLVGALLAGGGGEGQEEGYGVVGAELLRSVVESVVGSLDRALGSGAVNQLVDLLVDALLAQSSLVGLGAPQASETEESAATSGAHAALFQGVLAHLRGLLDALVDRAVQPPVAVRRPPTTTAPQRHQSGGKAAGKHQEAGEREEGEGEEEEDAQARVRAMAVRSTRRLVAGLLHAGRRIIERYQAESKRADAPPDAYVTAEAHVLGLLALLQSFRLPDWALPLAAPTSALLGRGPDERCVLLPEWVGPEEPPAQEQVEDEDDDQEDEDDGDYHLLQRGAAHPRPAHIFLLASPILDGCIGGSASSVVRAAALAALGAADVGGTFLRMRKEVDRHRRALDDAGLEIAQLRDETARLSVSSVAGLF